MLIDSKDMASITNEYNTEVTFKETNFISGEVEDQMPLPKPDHIKIVKMYDYNNNLMA